MSKTLAEMIAVMQAALDGKQIQYLSLSGVWRDCSIEPSWNWNEFDFRVKPEPETHRMTVEELTAEVAKRRVWFRKTGSTEWFDVASAARVHLALNGNWEISYDLKTWQKPEVEGVK